METNSKLVSAAAAAAVIKDADTVATNGFIGIGVAEEVLLALEKRYLETQAPKNLTLMYAAGQGDSKDRGENHFGHEGMLKRVVGGHWGLVPKVQKMALENKIEAYNFPQGVISQMYRDIAAKRPRTIVKTGLHTFVDPRLSGGRINDVTKEELVELIKFDGEEYLAYRNFPIDVAIIRGTTADTDGNISMEKEALTCEALAMAMAVKNSGGIVIVQVERLAEKNSLYLRDVQLPAIMVDYIVLSRPENHQQTFAESYNPSYCGDLRVPLSQIPPLEMGIRKIVARRGAFELSRGNIVNLGLGMPERVANVAAEEQILQDVTLTAEPGIIGGVPAAGLSFGAAANVTTLISQPSQFDFYDGGGLDIAFLGLAQADRQGNLNVSRFGPRYPGAGGFINISQFAKKVVFLGSFTAVGLKVSVQDGKISIDEEGQMKKFVEAVEHITFSGKYARDIGKPVLYVTERCVLQLISEGMELVEIAPGIDIDKHILPFMEFEPIIKKSPNLMDERIFRNDLMKLSIS